jgi:cell division protein FtsQ
MGQAMTDKWRTRTPSQRPAKRSRASSAAAEGKSLKVILGYMPIIGKILIGIVACVLVYYVYQTVVSASIFQLRNIDIAGTSHASVEDIQSTVKRAAKAGGVWKLDLAALKTELEKNGWIRSVVVSRVLPDGIRVRVTERSPRAIVRLSTGRLVWVDEDGFILETLKSTDHITTFFMRGWDEENSSETVRRENQERVKKYLEMKEEWDKAGLSERVSEVNLMDLRDVRAQLSGDDAKIEVRLGKDSFGKRLGRALSVLNEQRQTPRGPYITYLDVANDQRTTVGHSSGAQVAFSEIVRGRDLRGNIKEAEKINDNDSNNESQKEENSTRLGEAELNFKAWKNKIDNVG